MQIVQTGFQIVTVYAIACECVCVCECFKIHLLQNVKISNLKHLLTAFLLFN